jgi:hypothetical protein
MVYGSKEDPVSIFERDACYAAASYKPLKPIGMPETT